MKEAYHVLVVIGLISLGVYAVHLYNRDRLGVGALMGMPVAGGPQDDSASPINSTATNPNLNLPMAGTSVLTADLGYSPNSQSTL
jgi:hypothetical protein